MYSMQWMNPTGFVPRAPERCLSFLSVYNTPLSINLVIQRAAFPWTHAATSCSVCRAHEVVRCAVSMCFAQRSSTNCSLSLIGCNSRLFVTDGAGAVTLHDSRILEMSRDHTRIAGSHLHDNPEGDTLF